MSNTTVGRPRPTPLPSTRDEMRAMRDMKAEISLNDHVDKYYDILWESERFRDLLEAVWDEDAVEGSCGTDQTLAAMMIRDAASDAKDSYVAKKKIATIAKSLNVVMRRYHFGRKERRTTVRGETVRTDPGRNGDNAAFSNPDEV